MPARPSARARRPRRDDESVARFVERFALVLTTAGMQRMAARAFAALLVSESGTMTARELAEELRVSPAAVSGAVRYLEGTRLVRRAREPGERVDHYVLGDDAWYEAIATRADVFDALRAALDDGMTAVGSSSAAGERLAETREFFEYLALQMPLMVQRWRATRT